MEQNIGKIFSTFYEQNILNYIQLLQQYPVKLISLILDISIVVFLAYSLIKITKSSRAWQLLKGIAFLIVAQWLSKVLNLSILNYILSAFMSWGVILLIVIFQPEIRRALEQLGTNKITIFRKMNRFGSATSAEIEVITEGNNLDSWVATSSNEDLVTVEKSESGILVQATGKTTGTATITVMSADGSNLKKTCKVTVNNPATSLKLAPEKGRSPYIAHGKKLKLVPTFETAYGPVSSAGKKLEWTTDDSFSTSVDKNGNVKAKTPYGDDYSWIKITARTTDGSNLEASYLVNTCSLTRKVTFEVPGNYGWKILKGTYTMSMGYYIECFPTSYVKKGDPDPGYAYDIQVNKPGLSIAYTEYGSIYIYGDKPGTYKITMSCTDGSSAKTSFTLKILYVSHTNQQVIGIGGKVKNRI